MTAIPWILGSVGVVGFICVFIGLWQHDSNWIGAGLGMLFGDGAGTVAGYIADKNSDKRLAEHTKSILVEADKRVEAQTRVISEQAEKRVVEQTDVITKALGQRVNQMGEDELIESIKPLVGTQEVAAYLVHTILRKGFFYENHQTDITLSYESPEGPAPPGWLVVNETFSFLIHNQSDRRDTYRLSAVFTDLHGPQGNTGAPLASFEKIKFTMLDINKNPRPGQAPIEETKEDILRDVVDPPGRRKLVVHREYEFGPGDTGRLEVMLRGWEQVAHGEISVQTRLVTQTMTMKATFPDASFDVDATFAHSKAGDSRVCSFHDGMDGTVEARITGGLLPYQGITFTWMPKNSQKTTP